MDEFHGRFAEQKKPAQCVVPSTPTSGDAGSGGLMGMEGKGPSCAEHAGQTADGNVLCLDWVGGYRSDFICQNSLNCILNVYILLCVNYTFLKIFLKARRKKGRKKKALQPSLSSFKLSQPCVHLAAPLLPPTPPTALPQLQSLQLDTGCTWIWRSLTTQEVRTRGILSPGLCGGSRLGRLNHGLILIVFSGDSSHKPIHSRMRSLIHTASVL